MSLLVSWLGHASFQLSNSLTVYIDPWKIDGEPHDGDIVLISHPHDDHMSRDDIRAVMKEEGRIVACADVVEDLGYGDTLAVNQTIEINGVKIHGLPAYNVEKDFHPKENNWLGFVIEMDGRRIYYAGDTDAAPEVAKLEQIDVALMPVGGTFTFDASSAADAVNTFKPKLCVPYHWGDIVGNRKDAMKFAKKAEVPVEVLSPMDYLSI